MKTLQFVKKSKSYNSNHGGQIYYLFFKGIGKSYRTVLFDNMRNFKKWNNVINNAKRGDYICNLRIKLYKGKEIIDADSDPLLYTPEQYMEWEKQRYVDFYGVEPY